VPPAPTSTFEVDPGLDTPASAGETHQDKPQV
jgi:hypothetical protein